KGQLVNFPNSDDIRHHVYSFSAVKPFELKLYAGTPNQPLKFENAGVVVLGCNIHDSMVGYIYIADDKQVLVSDANGLVTLSNSTKQVTVWHPYQDNDIDSRQTV
ncbi:methylamine utilization protein, partial [Pseudoalteromonas sp. S1690]